MKCLGDDSRVAIISSDHWKLMTSFGFSNLQSFCPVYCSKGESVTAHIGSVSTIKVSVGSLHVETVKQIFPVTNVSPVTDNVNNKEGCGLIDTESLSLTTVSKSVLLLPLLCTVCS